MAQRANRGFAEVCDVRLMADHSAVPLSRYLAQDEKLALLGYDRKTRRLVAARLFDTKPAERSVLHRLEASRGRPLIAAPTTRVRTPDGVAEIQNLRPGDSVFAFLKNGIVRALVTVSRPCPDGKAYDIVPRLETPDIFVCGLLVSPTPQQQA